MKCFKLFLSFTILFVALFLGHGEDAYTGDTLSELSYNPNDFCSANINNNDAEKLMKGLQDINADKFTQLTIYKEDISRLIESEKLVSSVRDIKNRYLNGLFEITQDHSLTDQIGYAQSVVSDGEVLVGISSQPSPSARRSLKPEEAIRRYQTMKNLLNAGDTRYTQSQVDQIANEVPSGLSPVEINGIMNTNCPTIAKMLERNLTSEDVTACLENADCSKFKNNTTDDNNEFITTITNEMLIFSQKLKEIPELTEIPQELLNTNQQVSANSLRNAQLKKVEELKDKVQKLASETKFSDVESLKKYVAEKYMCSCVKTDRKSLKIGKGESLIYQDATCSSDFLTLSKIEGLSGSVNAIADALYAHEIKVPMDGESCHMTSEKLKPYAEICRTANVSIATEVPELCKLVKAEYDTKVKNEKEVIRYNARWEKFNKENYVEYDASEPNGYSSVRKKSSWQVVGEGVAPILPSILPIWFANYQTKNYITDLTNQGLFQKQYLHNVDYYNQSPWSYNYNYFGYGSPFMQGNSGLNGSPTTINSSILGGAGGFNFGQ